MVFKVTVNDEPAIEIVADSAQDVLALLVETRHLEEAKVVIADAADPDNIFVSLNVWCRGPK